MKKVVGIASIVFWLSFVFFIVILLAKSEEGTEKRSEKILRAIEIAHQEEIQSGKYVIVLVKDRAEPTLVLGALGILMAVCFTIMEAVSEPKPKLKHSRSYMLIAIVPLSKKGGYSIVLSYDDRIEAYQCDDVPLHSYPRVGSEYKVEIENGTAYFS